MHLQAIVPVHKLLVLALNEDIEIAKQTQPGPWLSPLGTDLYFYILEGDSADYPAGETFSLGGLYRTDVHATASAASASATFPPERRPLG